MCTLQQAYATHFLTVTVIVSFHGQLHLCRWGFTALDDALRFKKQDVADLLKTRMLQERPDFFKDEKPPLESEQDRDSTDSDEERFRRE